MFARIVDSLRTRNGTPYVSCYYRQRNVWDVTIRGVTIKNLTLDEYDFFVRVF